VRLQVQVVALAQEVAAALHHPAVHQVEAAPAVVEDNVWYKSF
jgi:hypothetical protein